jgi:hypothetical protein
MAYNKLFASRKSVLQFIKENVNNKEEFLKTFNLNKDEIHQIATLDTGYKDIINVFDNTLIFKGSKKDVTPKFADSTNISTNLYTNLNKKYNFFEELNRLSETVNLVKNQTGSQLIKNVTKLDKLNYTRTKQSDMVDFNKVYTSFDKLISNIKNDKTVIVHDLESLGGINSKGFQQYDMITELSAIAMQGNKEVKKINTILGFSEDEYKKIKNYLKGLEGKTKKELSNLDEVYLKRLSLFGDPNFKYEMDGFNAIVTEANSDIEVNLDNAYKGLEKYREIGLRQKDWAVANNTTLTAKKQSMIQEYADLVFEGKGINDKDFVSLGHNTEIFDNPLTSHALGKHYEYQAGKGADTYQAIKYIQEYIGQGAHIPKNKLGSNEFGIGTQDFLKNIFNAVDNESSTAHMAYEDTKALYNILNAKVNKGTYGSYLLNKLNTVKKKLNGGFGIFDVSKGKGVFFMDKTAQQHWAANKNGLSFIYDPVNQSYKTFDGYRIKDSAINKEGFNGFGPKSGGLYSHNVYELDINSENWNNLFDDLKLSKDDIEQFYQEYKDTDKLYVLQSKEYIPDELKNKVNYIDEGKIYTQIFTSKDQLSASMGTHVLTENKSGNRLWNTEGLNNLDLVTNIYDKNNNLAIQKVEDINQKKDLLLNRSSYRNHVDSSARIIREADYGRLSKIRKYNQSSGISISQRISNLIANNETLNIDLTQELLDEFGWYDFDKNKKVLLPETASKLPILDQYTQAIDPILSIMEEEWGNNFSVNKLNNGKTIVTNLDNKSLRAKKNLIFKNVMTNTLEDITEGLSPENVAEIVKNTKTSIFTNNELLKIDFDINDLFPNKASERIDYGVSGTASKYISIDLTKNNDLLNKFFNNKFGNIDGLSKKGQAGFNSLFQAYDLIAKDERFYNIWDNKLSYSDLKKYQKSGNISQLNDRMTNILRDYVVEQRKTNSAFGLKYLRGIQDYSDVNVLSGILSHTDKNFLKKSVLNNMRNAVDNYTILDSSTDISSLANQIVDRYMMTFNEDMLNEQISNLTADQQKVIRSQYNISLQEAKNTATNLLKAIKETDLSVGITGKGKNAKMFMTNGSRFKTFDLHRYTLNNGIINHNLNNIDYATNFALDVSGILNKNGTIKPNVDLYNNIKITSNVQKSMNESISLLSSVKYAKESNQDIMDALLYRIKKNEGKLREVGARREHWNFNNTIERAFDFDANALISILPELDKAGLINIAEQKHFIINDENMKYKEQMKSLINKIKDMKVRPRQVSELLPAEQNLFYQMYNFPLMSTVMNYVGDNLGDIDGVDYKDLASMINPHVQDVHNAKDVFTLNTSPFSHGAGKFDKSSRSVANQRGNSILYDKDIMKSELQNQLDTTEGKVRNVLENISIGSKVSNKAGEQFVNDVKQGKKNLTAGVTLKALQIDSNSLKNIFTKEVEKARNNENNKFSNFLNSQYNGIDNLASSKIFAEKAMGLSTYQQESVINARVSYIAMHENNKQMINKKKKLIVEHSENLNIIEATKNASKLNFVLENGKIHYQLGYEVKQGQILGVFGENETITSRFNGIFRGRYYDEFGNIVSEKELQSAINSSFGYDEVKRILDSKYNFGYEVVQKFEEYGHKLYNGASEKSTAYVADIGLGVIDTNLKEKLVKYGLSNDLGKVYGKTYFEEYMLPKLIQEGKIDISEAEDLKNQILKERFSFSDALSSEFEEFNGVGQLLAVNTKKHQSISFATDDIVERIYKSGFSKTEQEQAFKAIFGDVDFKGSTLLLDNSNSINVNKNELDKLLNKGLSDKLWSILDNKDMAPNGVGHYIFSNVTHAYDDPSGTYAGNSNYSELVKRLKQAKDSGNIDLAKSIEEEIAKFDRQKGLKFDNRMNLNLQRQVYNSDNFDLVRENLSGELFNKYFSQYYDESGKLSDKYLGKRVLDPVLSSIMDEARIGYGETLLKDAKGKRYDYLKSSFNSLQDDISVEYAEKAYSYAQGKKALLFNNKSNYTDRDILKLNNVKDEFNKFKLVDFTGLSPNDTNGWLDLDIGGQGESIINAPNNPYTNNLLIKTGLKDEGYQYLAVARMPEKHYQESMIAQSHIHKLGEVQRAIKQYNGSTDIEKQESINYVKSLMDDFKDLQKRDITGKEGLAGDLISTRFRQSLFGTGSGITINYQNELGKDSIEALRKINTSTFLDTATFNGKSLLEHYSNGTVIDAVGLSKEGFRKMGYFDKDFISKTLGSGKTEKDMMEALRTKGDMFFSTRFPRIQEGSDKVVMGYLVDDLKDNQILALGPTAESMNLDFDGDKFAVARISNKQNQSYLTYLSGNANYDDFMKSQEVSLLSRASTVNRYWDSVSRKQIEKESKIAADGSRIVDIAKESLIDGTSYSSILNFRDNSTFEYAKYLEDDNYKHLVKQSIESGSHDNAINVLKQRSIDGGVSYAALKDEYSKAYSYQLLKDELIAKSAKNSIGEINVTNTKLRSMLETLSDNLYEGAEYKSSLIANMMHDSEQAAISSKTSISGLSPDRAKEWNEHAKALIFNKGDVNEHRNILLDWGNEYLSKDVNPVEYYQRSSYFRNMVAEKYNSGKMFTEQEFISFAKDNSNLQKDIVSDFVSAIDEIRTQTDSSVLEDFYNNLSIGQSNTGVIKPLEKPTSSKLLRQTNDLMFDALSKASEDLRESNIQYLDKPVTSNGLRENILDSVISESEQIDTSTTKISEKVLMGTKDMFKSVKGSKIAMGALGIAAGVMMLGYAGGRPRPADTQAMEEAQDYPAPNLMDSGMMVTPNMGNQGYVVNINARTDKGRQNAIDALQQAIYNGTNSSINISMNINDNWGNISTDRYIEKIIDDTF